MMVWRRMRSSADRRRPRNTPLLLGVLTIASVCMWGVGGEGDGGTSEWASLREDVFRGRMGSKSPYNFDAGGGGGGGGGGEGGGGGRGGGGASGKRKDTPGDAAVAAAVDEAPRGCSALMVVGLLRHGSRDPGKSDCRGFERLQDILGQLPEGNKWRGWRNRYDCKRVHSLVQEGMIEHHGIGKRMAKRFPRLFGNYSSARHTIVSSHLERSSRSAASFAHGAWGGTGPSKMGGYQPVHIQTPSPSTKDLLLRFVDHCPLYEQIIDHRGGLSERDAFLQGEEVSRAAARISARADMPPGQVLSNKEAFSVYTACGFELAHGVKDGLCGLLGEEDVETFEYLDDLKHYYKKAGGHAVNRQMACPLLHHMVGALEARANGSSLESTHLMFAHAETLVPLLTRLGLFDGDAHLTSDLESEKRRQRRFRSSSVTPMAANLFLALYQCSQGPSHVVRAWLNEKPIRIPRCHGGDDYEHGDFDGDGDRGECSLRLLVERHVANEECSFDHSCRCDGSEGGGEEVCGKGKGGTDADRDCSADGSGDPQSKETPLTSAWPTSIDRITLSADSLSLSLATALASLAVAGAMVWAFMKI